MNGSTAEYCRQAAAPGSTLYYSLLFHAADERRALCALFAYQSEIDRVIDETTEAAVGHARLQWWQEETGRIFQSAARHPIGMELHWLTRRMVLDPAAFASCIAA
ncbi:MAG: squalene/phytoene synthase family protein, partial [Gammaproteobacteria bacterium]|nr:squalene/phytoene synthase family protein [Gammaproteobacteria bacterium]